MIDWFIIKIKYYQMSCSWCGDKLEEEHVVCSGFKLHGSCSKTLSKCLPCGKKLRSDSYCLSCGELEKKHRCAQCNKIISSGGIIKNGKIYCDECKPVDKNYCPTCKIPLVYGKVERYAGISAHEYEVDGMKCEKCGYNIV
jgi:hypothetical protein